MKNQLLGIVIFIQFTEITLIESYSTSFLDIFTFCIVLVYVFP